MSAITLKSAREIEVMRIAGRITAGARRIAAEMVEPGVTTAAIDREVKKFILASGATPTFLGYAGFPACTCISVNDEVIHGIPGKRKLKAGDIVSLDVGATYQGYVGDCAATFTCGECSDEARRLIEITRQCFFEALAQARSGNRIGDLSAAVQRYAEQNGCSVVREYVGHGIGRNMHEPPEVPNYGQPGRGPRLVPGMTIAVEPMINAGGAAIRVLPDEWTVVTADGSLSAHYENTILITSGEPEILTWPEGF